MNNTDEKRPSERQDSEHESSLIKKTHFQRENTTENTNDDNLNTKDTSARKGEVKEDAEDAQQKKSGARETAANTASKANIERSDQTQTEESQIASPTEEANETTTRPKQFPSTALETTKDDRPLIIPEKSKESYGERGATNLSDSQYRITGNNTSKESPNDSSANAKQSVISNEGNDQVTLENPPNKQLPVNTRKREATEAEISNSGVTKIRETPTTHASSKISESAKEYTQQTCNEKSVPASSGAPSVQSRSRRQPVLSNEPKDSATKGQIIESKSVASNRVNREAAEALKKPPASQYSVSQLQKTGSTPQTVASSVTAKTDTANKIVNSQVHEGNASQPVTKQSLSLHSSQTTQPIPKNPLYASPTASTIQSATQPVTTFGRSASARFQRATQQAADEAAIDAARAPLTNLYGPYLCKSTDSSLADARKRLKNAIAQTRMLRQAFTERVYGKYRVSLRPPPETDEIISRIVKDPVGQQRKLREETAAIREEKDTEKKEANKLNNEMAQTLPSERPPVLANIDNAEQLMYLTAGLSLVVLPEHVVDSQQSPEQRAKTISNAAATAGEAILDRTRKSSAMRVERQRRRQLQLLRGEPVGDGEADNSYSRLQALSVPVAPPATVVNETNQSIALPGASMPVVEAEVEAATAAAAAAIKRSIPGGTKGGRSQSKSAVSASALLSLNPTAEEVKPQGKPSAVVKALVARGVGPAGNKTTQQRLRHPHPDSLGGMRRANMQPSTAHYSDSSLQANLANTLPPLPASKERIERRPLPVKLNADESCSGASESVRNVLRSFLDKDDGKSIRPVSKICLLNDIRKLKSNPESRQNLPDRGAPLSEIAQKTESTQVQGSVGEGRKGPLNPSLALTVLHALGTISRTSLKSNNPKFVTPSFDTANKSLYSKKLETICGKANEEQLSLLEKIFDLGRPDNCSGKRARTSEEDAKEPPSKIMKTEIPSKGVSSTDSIAVETIRGGGEVLVESKEDSDNKEETKRTRESSKPKDEKVSAPKPVEQANKRKRSESSPTRTATQQGPIPNMVAPFLPPNAMQIASQLGHMHHPAAGDLAQYLGSLQQQTRGFDLSTVMSGATPSQLTALGYGQRPGLVGYSLQDRATAQTMLFREQQAAAMMAAYPATAAAGYPHVPPHPHPAAVPAFIGQQYVASPIPVDNRPMPHVGAAARNEGEAISMAKSNDKKVIPLQNSENSDSRHPRNADAAKRNKKEVDQKKTAAKSISENDSQPQKKQVARNNKLESEAQNSHLQDGMMFILPTIPPTLGSQRAKEIQGGLFYEAIQSLQASEHNTALQFLLSLGSAVPIPKVLVHAPLKERLNTPGFRAAGNHGTTLVSREVVASSILVWLWANHESTFRHAFEKNGRIDVDSECKWLVHAAVDSAVGELSLAIAESIARGEGAFSEASKARKINETIPSTVSLKLDISTASIVSKALAIELKIDEDLNQIIPKFSVLVELLDEVRLGALRAKAHEHTLLATFLSRKALISETFSQAYVSAMIRAGEAIGHGNLFELAQDEEVLASSMIPFDIFTDDGGAWEDPCRPETDFTPGLVGDELFRRAHARAMIQKSLKKLQDRHHIRGGTNSYGPFVDTSGDASSNRHEHGEKQPSSSPRPGPKRRFSSLSEPPIQPGTGSGRAKNWAVYDPRHFSSPLEWNPDHQENCPYGAHSIASKGRSMSFSGGKSAAEHSSKKLKISTGAAASQTTSGVSEGETVLTEGTREIDWVEIASSFQSVVLPKKSSRSKSLESHHKAAPTDGPIFAPLCRLVDGEPSTDEDESETEEDLSEDVMLTKHQNVLDLMKTKLDAFLIHLPHAHIQG